MVGGGEGGLRVVFDPALDGGSWPGPLAGRAACFGEAWLGPLGLLDRLEVELGLVVARVSPTERAAVFARTLAVVDGFWSRSFAADRLGTSKRLLADRDALALWGWQGEPVSARLAALWQVTAEAATGVPDRLRRILGRLPGRQLDIESIRVVEPIAAFPPLWQQVVRALADAGVRVVVEPLADAPATGDLAAARGAGFRPTGDGSLQLVRPHGPLAAAEEVAASLAASASLDGIVVVGADAVLDTALARHGVPRVGAAADAPGSRALVRWVLETAFHPMDPAALHGLLCADPGPVPRSIAWRLARALGSLPGRGSPDWMAALAEGLERIEEERRLGVAVRISALTDPVVSRDAMLTIQLLATRLRVLTAWARGRVAREPRLAEVIAFGDRVLALARAGGEPGYGRMALRRLCDEVDRDVMAATAAEVGLAGVTSPAALLGPARVVVWWGFTRDQAPRSPRLRLSAAERTGLAAAGVIAPDPGSMMAGEARRWRRPLGFATDALVLVCPRTDDAAAATHPHPLWDELVATMPAPDEALRLVAPVITHLVARRAPVALRPRLVGRDVAQAPGPLAVRSPESPSSVERLLACSLAWALHYPAMLRRGIGTGPGDPNPLLYGNLAHHVLAEVFEGGGLSPPEAAARADELFEAALPALAEQLLLPEHQVERAVAKRAVVESAREVGELLLQTGATIRGVEVPLTGSIGALAVDGRADLVLDNPPIVIDFKWGSTTYRKRMEGGAALQLAIYAVLAKTGTTMPGVAYLSLGTQHLVASRGTPIARARFTGTHSVDDMLSASLVGLDARVRELAEGTLVAPAALEDVDDSRLDGGVLRLAPACEYCDFSGLCGQRVRP